VRGNILSYNTILRLQTVSQGKYVIAVAKEHHLKYQKVVHRRTFKNSVVFATGLFQRKISDVQSMM
jgi:hypothetical protein